MSYRKPLLQAAVKILTDAFLVLAAEDLICRAATDLPREFVLWLSDLRSPADFLIYCFRVFKLTLPELSLGTALLLDPGEVPILVD